MLEASLHGDNCFVTLTYSDENLPIRLICSCGTTECDGTCSPGASVSLDPRHLQDFMKRLRKAIEPSRIRFYAVGEYGEETARPHYHLALFGYRGCLYGLSRYSERRKSCCVSCDLIRDTWGKGQVYLGTLEMHSAQYIAGYVTKKMTSHDDPRLHGRHPEFARMSLRPGIGYGFLDELTQSFLKFNLDASERDVPVTLRHGSRQLPLGRYLRKKMRGMVFGDEKTPEVVIKARAEEMRPLREDAYNNSKSFKSAILEKYQGERVNFEARNKLRKKRKMI